MTQLHSRRRFMLTCSTIALGGVSYLTTRQFRSTNPHETIDALVDTLIPEDDFAGGLSLGFSDRLQEKMRQQESTRTAVKALVLRLNNIALSTYKQPFQALSVDERESLLLESIARNANPSYKRHLLRLRNSLLSWYYSSHDGFQSLNYRPPFHYPAHNAPATKTNHGL